MFIDIRIAFKCSLSASGMELGSHSRVLRSFFAFHEVTLRPIWYVALFTGASAGSMPMTGAPHKKGIRGVEADGLTEEDSRRDGTSITPYGIDRVRAN